MKSDSAGCEIQIEYKELQNKKRTIWMWTYTVRKTLDMQPEELREGKLCT